MKRHNKMGDADLIIAATAHANQEKFITRDADFKILEDLMDLEIEI